MFQHKGRAKIQNEFRHKLSNYTCFLGDYLLSGKMMLSQINCLHHSVYNHDIARKIKSIKA